MTSSNDAGAEALLLGRSLHQTTLGRIVIDDQNRLRHNHTIIRRWKALSDLHVTAKSGTRG